jgi:HlyD family secretion protein
MKKILHSKIFLFLIAASLGTAGFIAYRQFKQVAPEQQYRLQAVEKGDISQTVSANGTINPVTLVNVGTQVSGTVKKLYVDFNSHVEKGQILLELDDALLAAQLKQDMASVQNARASVELASANEARTRNLYSQEYASRLEMDIAVQAKKSAQAQLNLTQATIEKDRAYLAYSVIRSPVSGVVVDRSVDVGQTVAASLQTPTLFKIAQDLAKMQIDSSFAEADIASIRVGQAVHFTVDAFPNRSFEGAVRLIRLNPTNVQNVITYDVVINVANPELILMPGMTAYVSIAVAERKDILMVPNAALRFKPTVNDNKKTSNNPTSAQNSTASRDAGKAKDEKNLSGRPRDSFSGRVYLLKNGKLVPVTVKTGITDNRNTEIISDELKTGDQVVTGDAQAGNATQGSGTQALRMRMF